MFSEKDIMSTQKKYLFSHLFPCYQQEEQDSRNLSAGEQRAGDTAPTPGWQFHLIPEKQRLPQHIQYQLKEGPLPACSRATLPTSSMSQQKVGKRPA